MAARLYQVAPIRHTIWLDLCYPCLCASSHVLFNGNLNDLKSCTAIINSRLCSPSESIFVKGKNVETCDSEVELPTNNVSEC